MPIIKDANYWMKSASLYKSKEWWKEYNQKRRAYLTEKERQRRQKLKGVYNQDSNLDRVQPKHVQPKHVQLNLSTTINYVQRVQPNISDQNVQPNQAACTTEESVQPAKEVRTVVDHVQPKEKVVDLESYNAEVYNRAGTSDPHRFFTFPNGQKIVRTMCGCNPTKDFYDWCLDSCEYFTGWRNKRKELQKQLMAEQKEYFAENEESGTLLRLW